MKISADRLQPEDAPQRVSPALWMWKVIQDFLAIGKVSERDTELSLLRLQNPWIRVLPFPSITISRALTASSSYDFLLPARTLFVRFECDNFYIVLGRADLTAGSTSVPNSWESSGSVLLDTAKDSLFDVRGKQQITVFAPSNCRLSLICYMEKMR